MNVATIAELDRRFGIPGIARVIAGNGGLAKVAIATRNVEAEMYLHGAHVTSWKPSGAEEVLFVSTKSRWDSDRAIRGGIPICFPWFGAKENDPSAPPHGFVRATAWQLESIVQAGEAVSVSMFTESSEDTRKWWPAEFHIVHRASFGSELNLESVVKNTGATALRFEEALHTYFRVGQIEKAEVHGLSGVQFLDKTDLFRKKTQDGPIVIESETDRVYLNTGGAIELEDHSLRRRIEVAKENSRSTVVWNPWIEKAKTMSDFGDAEWTNMICIEACNVADLAVELAPGQEHTMRAIIRLADLSI